MRKVCLVKKFIIDTQKLGKSWKGAYLGTRIPHSILVQNLLPIEIKILFPKLAMRISVPHKLWTTIERGIIDSHTNHLQA